MTNLDFSVNPKYQRDLKPGEYYYRIELADGREALVVAEDVVTVDGCLRCETDGAATVTLPAGSWRSVYMCEAMAAYDPWSILQLDAPADALLREGEGG
ncbi:hypothetical protein OG563_05990 [Nocardia vinacea]|uniref:Uncharacterized protein n=1 Tax=Nocardia vinacea TaxID=96468 RepID=A0ABZ1Z0Z7_9NOCA|nr:hypothetical protein [Nocardia vinacea]